MVRRGTPFIDKFWIGSRFVFLTLVFLSGTSARADLSDRETLFKSNELYQSLTSGVPLLPSNPLYSVILSRVKKLDFLGAAAAITDPQTGADEYFNNTVALLPQTMNQDGTAVGERNEMSAMFLVAARDGLSLRDLLTKDFTAYDPTGTPAGVKYAIDDSGCTGGGNTSGTFCNTGHYRQVWKTTNPRRSLVQIGHPGFPGIGVFTSYPWALNYDRAGTGRRNIKAVAENLYCVTMDALRTSGIPDTSIRQDIPRDDAGFVTDCKTCHIWMDNWVRPFLAKDLINGNRLIWQSPIKDKLNDIRGPNYPVTSASFDFFYTEDQNRILGIDESKSQVQTFSSTGVKFIKGENLSDFSKIIANSRGFYRCMVKRVVAQIYLKKLFSFSTFSADDQKVLDGQADTIEVFTNIAMNSGDLSDLYRRIAVWYTFGQ